MDTVRKMNTYKWFQNPCQKHFQMYFDRQKKQKQIHRTVGNKIDVYWTMSLFWWKYSIETKKLAKTYYGDFGKACWCLPMDSQVGEGEAFVLLVLRGRKNNNNKNTHRSSGIFFRRSIFIWTAFFSFIQSKRIGFFTRTPLFLYPSHSTRSSWFLWTTLPYVQSRKTKKNGRITRTCFHVGIWRYSLTTIFQRNAPEDRSLSNSVTQSQNNYFGRTHSGLDPLGRALVRDIIVEENKRAQLFSRICWVMWKICTRVAILVKENSEMLVL